MSDLWFDELLARCKIQSREDFAFDCPGQCTHNRRHRNFVVLARFLVEAPLKLYNLVKKKVKCIFF